MTAKTGTTMSMSMSFELLHLWEIRAKDDNRFCAINRVRIEEEEDVRKKIENGTYTHV